MTRSSTRLAMVAALQTLSARERAAVVLHDVVKLTSAEVAETLETTPAAINSALQRARARLADGGAARGRGGRADGTAVPGGARRLRRGVREGRHCRAGKAFPS